MLKRLRLERFKNFRDATLELAPLSVLVGANASGKSNLREAFRFLHGIGRGYSIADIIGEKYGPGGVREWEGIRGGSREAAFEGAESFALTVDLDDVGPASMPPLHDVRYHIEVGLEKEYPYLRRRRLSVGGKVVFDDGASAHAGRYSALGLGRAPDPSEDPLPAPTGLAQSDQHAIQAVRGAFARMQFRDLDPSAMRRPSVPGQVVLGDAGNNLSSVLQSIQSNGGRRAGLAEWIQELTPMDVVDFEFPEDAAGKILVSLVEKNGRRTTANSASDGTLRFLGMMAALLGPATLHPGFLFLEEIENGIHPARLHLLLNLIEQQVKRGDLQVVATSHSPELIRLLSRDSLDGATLVYRLPGQSEARIKPIVSIPDAERLVGTQGIGDLLASGWMENVMDFAEGDAAE